MKTEHKYLGHVVTGQGVKPDLENVKDVLNFPTPHNTTDVKSFLGLAGYTENSYLSLVRLRNL